MNRPAIHSAPQTMGSPNPVPLKVLVADDHHLVRDGLKLAILDGTGRVLAKTLSNRRRDRLVAEAIAAFCNQAPDDPPDSRKGDAR